MEMTTGKHSDGVNQTIAGGKPTTAMATTAGVSAGQPPSAQPATSGGASDGAMALPPPSSAQVTGMNSQPLQLRSTLSDGQPPPAPPPPQSQVKHSTRPIHSHPIIFSLCRFTSCGVVQITDGSQPFRYAARRWWTAVVCNRNLTC